jgi:hypothetical protein
MYKIIPNKFLKTDKVNMNCDKQLVDKMADPLPNYSFLMLIIGNSGSGKTNALYNLMKKGKNKQGVYSGYRGVFDNIIICSPSLSSAEDDIFKDLPDEKKFTDFDNYFLDFIDDFTLMQSQNDRTTLVILDDIGSSLRASQRLDKHFTSLLQNRRHRKLSCITIVQKYRDVGTGIRSNLTHVMLFRSVNKMESEAISNELINLPKDEIENFYDEVYDKKYNFLFIDMSLQVSPQFRYFKNYDQIII